METIKNNFMQPAKRLSGVDPFHVVEIMTKAKKMEKEGIDIIHMEVGEPDFTTAQTIMDAASLAIKNNISHYTPALGLPTLRSAIQDYYQNHLHCKVDANRVAVTPGASGAIQLILTSILDEGDEILLTDPGYPCNRNMTKLLSAKDINVPLTADNNFLVTTTLLEAYRTDKTRALLIASPSNPTGSRYSKAQIKVLADYCDEKEIHFIVDEIYQGLEYESKPFSSAEVSNNIWVINSFSKYFGMTGFRIGWLIAPSTMILSINKLAQNLFLAPASIAQYAALGALSDASIKVHNYRRDEFKKRRDFLYKGLVAIGFEITNMPEGAFYLYADCTKLGLSASALAEKLLLEAHVAVTPGKDFSTTNTENFIRFAYTTNVENLEKGLKRIKACLA